MCILLIFGLAIITSKSFSQEGPIETTEPPPEDLIREMLEDPEIPDELKRELEEMLRTGEIPRFEPGPSEEIPLEEGLPPLPEEIPPEEEFPPLEEIEEPEELERIEYERPRTKQEKPEIKISASSRPNKISLDLKGVDIIDVLKMLSARSNLNIVAGRNVRGRVTLFLKDVDVWEAFEIILAANNLAYIKEGEIINVMTERDYEQIYGEKYYTKKELRVYKLEYAKVTDVSKALNQAKSKIGKVITDEGSNTIVLIDSPQAISKIERMIAEMDMPIETKIFSLDYAKAEDIKTKVSEILTKNVGTIQVDERTNKVVITDLSENMPEIANIIGEMDEKHKEVLIEAKIVEISLTDQYQYGIDWTAIFRKFGDEGIRINLDNITGDVFTGGATGAALTLTSFTSNYFDAAIEILEGVGHTNVISSPRITVLNNEEAKVLVGTNQPYIEQTFVSSESGTDRTDETIKWIDVGVELTVTPTINKDGFVTMKIKPKISSVTDTLEASEDDARTAIPVVSTSESETTVMVQDGTTIVIAGLIEDREQEAEQKVPFLGDIPLLGNLFKRKSVGSVGTTDLPEKKELVVFLTPYIIHGTETFPEADNTWYGDRIEDKGQRELLEQQMSRAVEDLQLRRNVLERPVPKEEIDTTTRISEDLGWFKKKEGMEELKEKRSRLQKELEPERGTVPEKVLTKDEAKREERPRRETVMLPANLITPSVSEGYYGYLENVRNRIYYIAKSTYPAGFRGKEDVKVLFTLTNDGGLKGEPEVVNGVDKELAKAAIDAVEIASPFPPFPKRMDKAEEIFRITITYQ
jgi:type II secretory pathway component GspD/PulD (secretin)